MIRGIRIESSIVQYHHQQRSCKNVLGFLITNSPYFVLITLQETNNRFIAQIIVSDLYFPTSKILTVNL